MTDDPDALMRKGLLLKDLRYRFGVCGIRIPPLRERRPEIPLLAQRALQKCPEQTKLDGPSRFTDVALAFLCEAEYEGNVRELGAVIQYGYLMARAARIAEIGTEHLPLELRCSLQYKRHGDPTANRIVVERVLKMTRGNATAAAKLLGVSRNTLNAIRGVHSIASAQDSAYGNSR